MVGFIYLANQWSKTESSPAVIASASNMKSAITFAFFSVFTWVGVHFASCPFCCACCTLYIWLIYLFGNRILTKGGSAFYAYQRYRQGADSAFATAYETGAGAPGAGGAATPGSGSFISLRKYCHKLTVPFSSPSSSSSSPTFDRRWLHIVSRYGNH